MGSDCNSSTKENSRSKDDGHRYLIRGVIWFNGRKC